LSRLFYIFLLILSLLPVAARADFKWDIVTIDGEEYVSVESLREYYQFSEFKITGSEIQMRSERPDMNMDLRILKGRPDLYIKGIRFVMSYNSVFSKGAHRVSRTDQSRLIDPVLRPKRIARPQLFHTVVIDPGHGGYDTGTKGRYGNEKIFNLALGLKLKGELERMGFRVRMTRSDDSFPTLAERVAFANRVEESIFISLHFNYSSSSRVKGVETYSMSPAGTTSTNSGSGPGDKRRYQGNLRDQENIALSTAVHAHVIKRCAADDRGIKRARFDVLAGVNCPAVLLEGGFLSNSEEARKVASTPYQVKMAAAIAEGIKSYSNALRRR